MVFYKDPELENEEDFEDEEDFEEEDGEDEEESEGSEPAGQKEKVSFSPAQQEKLQALINKNTATARKAFEKRLKQLFGTSDLNTAAEYYKAGFEISRAAKAKPSELVQRLRQQQGAQSPAPEQTDVEAQIAEIRALLSMDREEKDRELQENQAKAEFGDLYSENVDAIEDLADERGLSLVDAAAIVLRPRLKEIITRQAEASRDKKRKRRVDSTSEGVAGNKVDYAAKLTQKEKRTAIKMGLTLKQYYEHAKAAGNLD